MSGSTPSDKSFVENTVFFNKENILILKILLTKMDVDFTRALAEKRKALFPQRQDFFNPRPTRSRKNSRQISRRVDNQTSLLGQFSLSHNLLWHISARGINYPALPFWERRSTKIQFRMFSVRRTPKTVCFYSVSRSKTFWNSMPKVIFLPAFAHC
jgi:hypothetical protein